LDPAMNLLDNSAKQLFWKIVIGIFLKVAFKIFSKLTIKTEFMKS